MLLPNREKAYVPERKLTSYLLSLTHPVGKSKAQFFYRHGFTLQEKTLICLNAACSTLHAAKRCEQRKTRRAAQSMSLMVPWKLRRDVW